MTLAERFNGTKWKIQPTPNHTGVRVTSQLTGVACVSASACTAVGSSDDRTLAERWNGAKWKIQPTPTTGSPLLSGVACTSANACTAVGNYDICCGAKTATLTLAERWNGTNWKIQSTPNPPSPSPNPESFLGGVACTSASVCTAVGNYYSGRPYATFAERYSR